MSFHSPKLLYTEQKQLPPPLKDYVTLNVTQNEIGMKFAVFFLDITCFANNDCVGFHLNSFSDPSHTNLRREPTTSSNGRINEQNT